MTPEVVHVYQNVIHACRKMRIVFVSSSYFLCFIISLVGFTKKKLWGFLSGIFSWEVPFLSAVQQHVVASLHMTQ